MKAKTATDRSGKESAGHQPTDSIPHFTAIAIQKLAHEFPIASGGRLSVIECIDAEVLAGETVAIIGPSGSGKTTFLNLVAGRLRPTSGKIQFYDSADPTTIPPGQLGMVFQQPSLLPWRTVRENVALPLELIDRPADASAIVSTAINRVGLSGFEDYLPSQVSGGMQSRTGLARALVTSPRFLLMDEPFGALDEITAEALNVHLSSLLSDNAVTALIVTHQLAQAVFLADRVWVFSNRPATLFADVQIDFVQPRRADFLESDYFFDCIRKIRAVMSSL
jgi:NitT/TauT family transport system ATP-binding protein